MVRKKSFDITREDLKGGYMHKDRCIIVLFVFTSFFFCIACSSRIESWVIEAPGVSDIGDDGHDNRDYDVTLLTSQDELSNFISQERMTDVSSNFQSKLNHYDSNSYFSKSYLIVIFIEFNSTGSKPSFSDASIYEGTLSISLSITQNIIGGDIIVPWAILVEYPKKIEISSVVLSLPE